MESILVLDASQNFKICISFPSLDIKSFFVLNLLYCPSCVNILLFIFINIIFIANCCILFWYIRPITQFADSTKDFISCPYAKRTKRPSLERPSCVLYTCLQSFYQFRLNSASVRSGFFCSAQRILHSLLKMSRLCPRKSCTHFVSEARLSAVGSVPSLVIQRM